MREVSQIADYHIHTKYSKDCLLEPRKIVQKALKKGLTTIGVTDHNTIKGGLAVKEINRTSLNVIVGAEICTDKGEIIGLYLEEEIKSRKLKEVIKEIKKQEGKVFVPHPFDLLRKTSIRDDIYEIIDFIDYIEGYNGRNPLNYFNKKAQEFGKQHNIKILNGSDAHHLFEIGHVSNTFFGSFTSKIGIILTKLIQFLLYCKLISKPK